MSKKVSSLVISSLMAFSFTAFADVEIAVEKTEVASVPVVPAAPAKEVCTAFTGRVRGNKVRLRTQPTLDGSVVREIVGGEMFVVNGQENDFYAVVPPKETKGYIFRTFVLEGTVEGERVNVRLYPDTEAPIVARLNSGDHVNAVVSSVNNKWLEIDLPKTAHFYIAKEFVENIGPADLLVQLEARKHEASSELAQTFAHAREELLKPFDDIHIDEINQKFDHLTKCFSDFPEIVEKAREANRVIEETFVQKKIAFLESKADRVTATNDIDPTQLKKLIHMGKALKSAVEPAATPLATEPKSPAEVTDKMLIWKPIEDSLFNAWASIHDGQSEHEFYEEEEMNATVLTGIVEPYNRPVKNRPGDFLLRAESLPVAFLYSTHVNLQDCIGKKVTLVVTPRPNNNFAFPAYFVLSVE